MEKEACAMFAVQHEHLIRGLGVVMEPQHLCLIFEYAEYGSLSDAMRRISIPWKLKLKFAYQVSKFFLPFLCYFFIC